MDELYYGKVVGCEIYANDVVVQREGCGHGGNDAVRGDIVVFSKRSRERLAFVAANTPVTFGSMVTLTYPRQYPSDGKTVKRHLRAFLQSLRRVNKDVQYLWFCEFQKRGAPHFHVLIAGIEVTKERQKWVSQRWYDIVDSNDGRHLQAGTRFERVRKKDGAKRYAVKYAYKMRQKVVPEGYRNVGRFWGHSSGVKPEPTATIQCNEDDIIAGLEIGEWEYHRGNSLHYKVLYGTAEILTSHFSCDTLVLSTSEQTDN